MAAFGIVLIASSPPASAAGTLDQSQEAQTDLNGVPLVGSQVAAQTFTAGRKGALDQVDLLLTRYETPGSLTVEIRTSNAGVPTSQVIASGSVVDTSLDTDPFTYEWVSVVLSPAAVVGIGTQYAIVVRDAGGAIFPTDYFVWAEAEFNPYVNGMAATSVDSGATWFPAESADFAFRTFVSTECTITGTEGNDVLEGTREDDVICGLGGNDKLDGGPGGDDLLLGGDGRDVLVGRSGADTLRGEGGNDILDTRDGVRGNDTADGGDGLDRCRVDRGDVVIDCP